MNPVKKVMHLNIHYQRFAGAEALLFNTLEGLESRGIENCVVYKNGGEENTFRKSYCLPEIFDIKLFHNSDSGKKLEAVIKKEKPDLIHLYDWGNPDILDVCLNAAPVIQTALNHGFYCPGGSLYLKRTGKACERNFGPFCLPSAFLNRCNSIRPSQLLGTYTRSAKVRNRISELSWIALSQDQKKRLAENGAENENVHVLPPGISFHPEVKPLPTKPVLLFVGRLIKVKGLHIVLDALTHMKVPAELLVDGEGPDRAYFENYAANLGLQNRVKFLGWCLPKEHWENYQKAFAVAVPSIWPEPFGMVGPEAMSFGRPVVGARIGGIPDWLQDGVTGFLAEPGQVKDWAQKLDKVLHSSLEAEAMGKSGRIFVQQNFSSEKFTGDLLSIYQQVLKRAKDK